MNTLRDELLVLRSSLLEDEFEWSAAIEGEEVVAWERYLEDEVEMCAGLVSPDYFLQITSNIQLHVQYSSPAHFNATIRSPLMNRDDQATLNAEVSDRKSHLNEEVYPVFTLLTWLKDWVQSNPIKMKHCDNDSADKSDVISDPPELRLKEVLFWSHHLLATGKRKNIMHWASELELWVISKPGYPGVIMVEGLSNEVDEFVYRIKQLNWKALQIRYESQGPVLSPPESIKTGERRAWALKSMCKLVKVINIDTGGTGAKIGAIEVEGMAEVGQLMKQAGLEDVFLTVLKLSK